MDFQSRLERRRVRWFFAGLVVISAVIDIVGALLVQHQTRSQVLETLLPAAVTLGGRTGAVLSGLSLLLLAGGIARGKRVAFRLTLVVLAATVGFELVKDLDFEAASLFAWILFGLWWFRHHFDADSDPARLRWGVVVFVLGILMAALYALAGSLLLENQLQPEGGPLNALESLVASLAGSPTAYRALTERANWFLASLPVVSYGLVIVALTQLLRPVLAPRAAAADRERVHRALPAWGRNYISHLAVHGASSYHWIDGKACIAFTLRGRTALALGDPLGPPDVTREAAAEFVAYCDTQDWIPAFYQVDEPAPYRDLGLTLIPIGAEALLHSSGFSLAGKKRADLRYAIHRCEKQGISFQFARGPEALALHHEQLQAVSGRWLQSRHSPELRYSLGTLATLADPGIVVGLAFAADGRLEAFVSWLPVPAKSAWTLDLMRRGPESAYGVMEALIVRSIDEARGRGVARLSLGVAPRVIASPEVSRGVDRAMRAMYWGLDRFQRSRTLRRFKEKFGPQWEDRYLVVPNAATLPEVMVALARAHVPTASAATAWLRLLLSTRRRAMRDAEGRPVIA
jgi:phosphatidylglycerol lysyltransferase